VGFGWVSPADFWRLSPGEIWWLIDAKTAAQSAPSHDEYEELYQLLRD